MNLSDIDFAELYRRQMLRANRQEKTPGYWDGRALAMSQRMSDSRYVRQFVASLDLTACATLLDVGCGPGTIALTVAPRLEHVYGLDYSPGMLAAFAGEARARGLEAAATPILHAWDDDWADVPTCDLVVASRSTAVPDLEAAILKLHSKARKRVYMSYPADGRLPGIVEDSIIGSGSMISGGRVERSIIGHSCRLGSYSHVTESILMEGVRIGRHAEVRRCIVDKGVVVPDGLRLGCDPEWDAARFTVSPSGVVVIPRHADLTGIEQAPSPSPQPR